MKRYIAHIQSKEPHERRRHAVALAGAVTGLFALLWLATFSARLGAGVAQDAAAAAAADPTQTAAAAAAVPADQAQLQISTTSVYSQ